MEARFTDILKRLGCTCITISHRPALVAFHDMVLALDGEGGWQLLPGQRKRKGGGAASGGGSLGGQGAGAGERAADASYVNAAMSGSAGMSAQEEEGNAQRTVLASLLPRQHRAVATAAAESLNAALMRDRLEGVRHSVGGYTLPQQWRKVADVLFAKTSAWALTRQFAGIGAIVLARTLLQVRLCVWPCSACSAITTVGRPRDDLRVF